MIKSGISVNTHIDNILSCFFAAMPVSGPLPALLGEALERVYEYFPDKDYPPILSDLFLATKHILEEKKYSSETTSDIKAALEVRLGILTRRNVGTVFQCRQSIPSVEGLMKTQTLIELDHFSQDQSSLLTLFLLTTIREYLKTEPKTAVTPRYVIIIEEAHNLVGNVGDALPSSEIPNPKAYAAEYVCRMLAELRSLGVGIVIIDQLPSSVSPEVIKNTTSKIAFRQVAKTDREELGSTMLLDHIGMEEIARLSVGEAYFFTEGYHQPRRIITENLHDTIDFGVEVFDKNILPYFQSDSWYNKQSRVRLMSELDQLKIDMDYFDEERLDLIGEFIDLRAHHPQIVGIKNQKKITENIGSILIRVKEIKEQMLFIYKSFVRNSFKKYISCVDIAQINDINITEVWKDLLDRFEKVIEPDMKESNRIITAYIKRLEEDLDGKKI
jgi:hypothetical protein